MAVLMMEGFDHVADASDLFSGLLGSSHATSTLVANAGSVTQFGGRCLSVQTSNPNAVASTAYVTSYISTSSATVVVGVSIALEPTANSGYDIGFTNGIVCQIFCRFILNHLYVYRGDPVSGTSVQIGTGVTGLVSNGWGYVEIKALIAPSGGTVSVTVNGTQVVNLTGLNTSNDGTATVAGVALGAYDGTGSGFTASYDDLYVLDTTGPLPNNTLLGPIRVITRYPNGNSSVSFTSNLPGVPNWQVVDESDPDGNTSYNSSGTVAASDSFTSTPLPTTTTVVFAVQIKAAVRKDDGGVRTMATVLNSASAQAIGATVALAPSFQFIYDIYPLDPNISLAWTVNSVNASTFGYTIVN